ncbi:MAG: LuxR C-terminal-related transcriptional regulator [Burkholderiaceae bacterium]
MSEYIQYAAFKGRMLIVGFGSIGQGSLPLLMRHVDIRPDQITIVTAHESGREIAERYRISLNTTKAHVRELLQRLGVRNRTEAATLYYRSRQGPSF